MTAHGSPSWTNFVNHTLESEVADMPRPKRSKREDKEEKKLEQSKLAPSSASRSILKKWWFTKLFNLAFSPALFPTLVHSTPHPHTHTPNSSSSLPWSSSINKPRIPPAKHSKPDHCILFNKNKGSCPFGADCRFIHKCARCQGGSPCLILPQQVCLRLYYT